MSQESPGSLRFLENENDLVTLVAGRVPDLIALYVFGSRASGAAGPGSDVDLAFLAKRSPAAEERFDLQEELAALLGTDVDLVDLRRSPTVLQMQIVSKGKLLDERDHGERASFEDFVFSSYARLNEERRGILEQVFREGRVYGG